MLVLLLKCLYSILKSVLMLHCSKNILTVKAVPRCSYNNRIGIMLTKKCYTFSNLLIPCSLCMRKHDCRSVSNLIVIKLAEVLHIHLALINISNSGKAIKNSTVLLSSLCRTNNVGKLTNARGLDNNSVGIVFLEHLNKCLGKIAHKRAADTTRVHLGDLNTCIGKETTVNTDFTEFVLNKNNLLACICFFNQLLDKGSLACSKKAGKYINLCHFTLLLNGNIFTNNIILQIYKKVKGKEWNIRNRCIIGISILRRRRTAYFSSSVRIVLSISNIANTIVGVTNSLVDDLVVLSFKPAVGVKK